MTHLSLLRERTVLPAVAALFLLFTLSACSTTERAADATADAATDVADATADVATDVAEGTAYISSSAYETVTDGAENVYESVADYFDDDADADAVALVRPTAGSTVEGVVRFEQMDGGTEVYVSLRGLDPGAHGVHIHENGDCSAPDGSSAGGHWDPMNTNEHGGPFSEMENRHMGDLGNFTAGDNGVASESITIPGMMVEGEYPLAGQAIIVHSGRDDLETDPAGDAGNRMACGVIAAND